MPFNTIIIILLILLIISIIIGVLIIIRHTNSKNASDDPLILNNLINELRRDIQTSTDRQRTEISGKMENLQNELTKNLTQSATTLQKHFSHTSTIIRDVTERLTKLDDTNTQVLKFSEQLQSLENILKNPKQRGILGEYWLETLLDQVLQPTQYKMQYDLGTDEKNGQKLIPDAVIFIKEIIIPIDAKFSLENYNRIMSENDPDKRKTLEKIFKSDVKKRIDETSKYIRPEMGTTNFAFMFVPAEGVYHNLIVSNVGAVEVNSRNLIEYAFEKGVMIVSPTSFFAYLQTVIMGLKALQIEESVAQIQKQAEQLMRHLKAYEEYHNKIGKHLDTTYRAFNTSSKELRKIDKDIFKITEGSAGKELEPIEIEKLSLE